MKIAFAGKGGVGKTSLTSWMADWLIRNGKDVWLIDADTALSLGQASGLSRSQLPLPLVQRKDLIRNRIHDGGLLHLNPEVADIPDALAVEIPFAGEAKKGIVPGRKRLLLMGAVTNAGGGCACDANALLKAVLAHIVMDNEAWVLVDLEAGVEHLGRGTVAHVDGLVVVSEPSMRSLDTASEIGKLAHELGLKNQILVLNRYSGGEFPQLEGLPEPSVSIPLLEGLLDKQLNDPSVLQLPESEKIDHVIAQIIEELTSGNCSK